MVCHPMITNHLCHVEVIVKGHQALQRLRHELYLTCAVEQLVILS